MIAVPNESIIELIILDVIEYTYLYMTALITILYLINLLLKLCHLFTKINLITTSTMLLVSKPFKF